MGMIQNLFSKAHYQKLEEEHLKHLFKQTFDGKSLLDVGCGQGRYLHLLQPYCSKISGIDVNPEQVQKLCDEGFDVCLPGALPPQKYDIILMSHIVEHLTAKELVDFIDTYLPYLEKDGYLIILTPMPGIRFWHDYTHIRPYTPQSMGMLFGILGAPAAFRSKAKMTLKAIHFFRDSWRIRNSKFYFMPSATEGLAGQLVRHILWISNIFLAGIYLLSHRRLGTLASWMGIYQNIDSQ